MKQPENLEGPKATENFEEGMKALFKGSQIQSRKGREEEEEEGLLLALRVYENNVAPTTTRGASLFLTLPQRDGIALLRTGTSLLTS